MSNLLHHAFGKHLLITNAIGTGLLKVIGDRIAAELDKQETVVKSSANETSVSDQSRISKMFLAGSVQGPVQHFYYRWLDRRYGQMTPAVFVKKVLMDMSIMSPATIVIFLLAAGYAKRQPLEELWHNLHGKFLAMYLDHCLFWPVAQFVNFALVPAPYRVLYVNTLTLLYSRWLVRHPAHPVEGNGASFLLDTKNKK